MTHADRVYQRLQQPPDSVAAEVLDFLLYLEQKQRPGGGAPERRPGSAKGQVWMADDFDAPLDDFKDHQ